MEDYLKCLNEDIKNNKEIMAIMFDPSNRFTTVSSLRKEFSFFDDIGLELNDVLVRKGKKVILTSPKNINVMFGKQSRDIIFSYLYRNVLDENKKLKDIDIIYEYMFINKYYCLCAKSSYLHEITHTQFIEYKNVEKIINTEILPIFIEILYGDKKNINELLYKIKFLTLYIDAYYEDENTKKDKLEAYKYIISTLKAIELFNLYKSNNNIGRDIISDISKVFDYDITLEEVLKKYEITSGDKPDFKTLIKEA